MRRIFFRMFLVIVSSLALTLTAVAQDGQDFENYYGLTEEEAGALEDNPGDFYGQTVTVEGVAENIVGPNSFILQDYEPFDLTPGEFLVFDSMNSSFVDMGADINEGSTYRVTGTFWNYDFDTVTTELGYELDEGLFSDYSSDDYVMIAEDVEFIEAMGMFSVDDDILDDNNDEVIGDGEVEAGDATAGVSTDDLGDATNQGFGIYDEQCNRAYVGENFLGLEAEMTELIEDNPTEFYGTTVTVEGYVDEILQDGFILRDNEPFDFSPPDFAIIDPQNSAFGGMSFDLDDNLCVTGTIYPVDAEEIQSELDITLEEGWFAEFDATSDDFAMIAENVSILDEDGVVVDRYTIDNPTMGVADPSMNDMDSLTGVYDEACSAAYAGENFLGLEAEVTEMIENTPEDFLGTSVTIEGYVDQVLANGFILQDNEPFDFNPPDFVIVTPEDNNYGGMMIATDDNLCVTGTVYRVNAEEIQSELMYTLDEGYFDQFDLVSDDFAMVAENISILDADGGIVDTYTYQVVEAE